MKEIEFVMQTFPKRTPGPGGFTVNSIKHLRKKILTIDKLFHVMVEKILPNSLRETSIHQISKPNQHQKRKSLADTPHVHRCEHFKQNVSKTKPAIYKEDNNIMSKWGLFRESHKVC